ncbi:hypothetical protein BKA70DRAFT_729566 [Coprinopsis sp. MPI-PUGE-AT-0042]|nr:hypothetical protein BKA70DRAFT_729566 [Coprinopsis sp. MPI-PUGE-AT-0042]
MWYDGPYDDSDDDGETEWTTSSSLPDITPTWTGRQRSLTSIHTPRSGIRSKRSGSSLRMGKYRGKRTRCLCLGPRLRRGRGLLQSLREGGGKHLWREALDPLGQAVVQKLGAELSRGSMRSVNPHLKSEVSCGGRSLPFTLFIRHLLSKHYIPFCSVILCCYVPYPRHVSLGLSSPMWCYTDRTPQACHLVVSEYSLLALAPIILSPVFVLQMSLISTPRLYH